MSESLIEELERRCEILLNTRHPCVSLTSANGGWTLNLGHLTEILIGSRGYLRVKRYAAAFIRKDGVVRTYDTGGVKEVVTILRKLTVLDELADV